MFQIQRFNGQDHFGVEAFTCRVAGIAHRFLDRLLGGHADLFEKFAHAHVEFIAHLVLLSFKITGIDVLARLPLPFCALITPKDTSLRFFAVLFLIFWSWSGLAQAQSPSFRLSAPAEIVETGFLKHLLPRFSLKNGIRIEIVDDGTAAELQLNRDGVGQPAFSGPNHDWYVDPMVGQGTAHVARLMEWLTSETGKRTISSFKIDGSAPFTPARASAVAVVKSAIGGNAVIGEKLSLTHCGRCHVINEKNRMNAIGSTPSFSLLRSFDDWDTRFQSFYALRPHPAFTQIAGVSEPFSIKRPPPIVPIELAIEQLEAILAYVETITPANLGAPITAQ